MIEHILDSLRNCNYDSALDSYLELFNQHPEQFQIGSDSALKGINTHLSNASNLARKKGFDSVEQARKGSPRLASGIDSIFGLVTKSFEHSHQQPTFFYVPELPSSGFFEVDQIPKLDDFLEGLKCFMPDLLTLIDKRKQNYIDMMGQVPDTAGWQNLRNGNWLSQHLIKSHGEDKCTISGLAEYFENASVVADCPPHAPEAFISYLLPGAKIPSHFGLSNVKLTVHVPLQVNSKCNIKVGKETKNWVSPPQKVIIFDDSFEHSAENLGEKMRSVLIFDIWNPHLSDREKTAIRLFMKLYNEWSTTYGVLASLDKHLHV
jgi:aspartyl/asparaginyl beta-hydroxylase (cupin superfamily)